MTSAETEPERPSARDWMLLLGACVVAGGAVWQRLLLERMLPAPPPALVVPFWALLLAWLWFHHASAIPARRAAAWLVLAAVVAHLARVTYPTFHAEVELEAYQWHVAGYLSTAYYGLPLPALLASMGVLAGAWLSAQVTKLPNVAAALAIVVLLFGATTVLGYATGSPWPFGV